MNKSRSIVSHVVNRAIASGGPVIVEKPCAMTIIERSARMHPTLFAECLRNIARESAQYGATLPEGRTLNAVRAHHALASFAADCVESGKLAELKTNMGAGVIALHAAAKLQCLPFHVQSEAAEFTWPSDRA